MTFGKLNAVSMVGGIALGVACFVLMYVFRDALASAAEIGSPAIWARTLTIAALSGGLVGWGIAVLATRVTDECGARLLMPLFILVASAIGTAIALEQQFAPSMLKLLVGPTILAGAATAVTATVYGWIDS